MALTKQQQQEKDLQRLEQLRPIDDDFMRCLLKDNVPLAEFVLRIITDRKDLTITDCETQRDMKRLAGARSICLDAYGTDSDGKKYDLEIQKAGDGADPHRASYHPVYWMWRTCIPVRSLRSCRTRTQYLLRRKTFTEWGSQSIQ